MSDTPFTIVPSRRNFSEEELKSRHALLKAAYRNPEILETPEAAFLDHADEDTLWSLASSLPDEGLTQKSRYDNLKGALLGCALKLADKEEKVWTPLLDMLSEKGAWYTEALPEGAGQAKDRLLQAKDYVESLDTSPPPGWFSSFSSNAFMKFIASHAPFLTDSQIETLLQERYAQSTAREIASNQSLEKDAYDKAVLKLVEWRLTLNIVRKGYQSPVQRHLIRVLEDALVTAGGRFGQGLSAEAQIQLATFRDDDSYSKENSTHLKEILLSADELTKDAYMALVEEPPQSDADLKLVLHPHSTPDSRARLFANPGRSKDIADRLLSQKGKIPEFLSSEILDNYEKNERVLAKLASRPEIDASLVRRILANASDLPSVHLALAFNPATEGMGFVRSELLESSNPRVWLGLLKKEPARNWEVLFPKLAEAEPSTALGLIDEWPEGVAIKREWLAPIFKSANREVRHDILFRLGELPGSEEKTSEVDMHFSGPETRSR